MKDKAFLSLSLMFFLIFFAGIAVVTMENNPWRTLRAKDENPAPAKSFGVVFPQVGRLGMKLKVSIYLRDVNGNSLGNRPVKLSSNPSTVEITPADTQNTNNIGMAEFFVSAQSSGKIQLSATDVNSNVSIINIPSVEFTE